MGIATLLLLFIATPLVFSAPPGSRYNPGETLAPSCAPGDTNCTVIPPAKSGVNDDITEITALTVPLSVPQGGTGTSTIFSLGSLLFTGSGGVHNADNANLFWNDANNRLGIGTTTPQRPLDVAGTVGAIHIKGLGVLRRLRLVREPGQGRQ